MRTLTFSNRTAKEILRDPANIGFGLGFPVILLLILSAIEANIPVPLFEIAVLSPGIAVFGLSFLTLFTATLIAKDRGSSFLQRLYTTPLTPKDFILGYTLPVLPIGVLQVIVCYALAVLLGLAYSPRIFLAVLCALPAVLLFIALGLLCGSIFTDKQVGGFCGALLTNLTAWLSGTWFDLKLVGGWFEKIAYALPFVHAVELERAALNGAYRDIFPHLCWVLAYALVIFAAAIAAFLRQMKER